MRISVFGFDTFDMWPYCYMLAQLRKSLTEFLLGKSSAHRILYLKKIYLVTIDIPTRAAAIWQFCQ